MPTTPNPKKNSHETYIPDQAPFTAFLESLIARLAVSTDSKNYPVPLDDIINLQQPWDPQSVLIQLVARASETLYHEDGGEWDWQDDEEMVVETVDMAVAMTRAVKNCIEHYVGNDQEESKRESAVLQRELRRRKRVMDDEENDMVVKRLRTGDESVSYLASPSSSYRLDSVLNDIYIHNQPQVGFLQQQQQQQQEHKDRSTKQPKFLSEAEIQVLKSKQYDTLPPPLPVDWPYTRPETSDSPTSTSSEPVLSLYFHPQAQNKDQSRSRVRGETKSSKNLVARTELALHQPCLQPSKAKSTFSIKGECRVTAKPNLKPKPRPKSRPSALNTSTSSIKPPHLLEGQTTPSTESTKTFNPISHAQEKPNQSFKLPIKNPSSATALAPVPTPIPTDPPSNVTTLQSRPLTPPSQSKLKSPPPPCPRPSTSQIHIHPQKPSLWRPHGCPSCPRTYLSRDAVSNHFAARHRSETSIWQRHAIHNLPQPQGWETLTQGQKESLFAEVREQREKTFGAGKH